MTHALSRARLPIAESTAAELRVAEITIEMRPATGHWPRPVRARRQLSILVQFGAAIAIWLCRFDTQMTQNRPLGTKEQPTDDVSYIAILCTVHS